MGKFAVVLMRVFVVLAAQLPLGLTVPLTSPAFLWSSHQDGLKEGINYQTLSPKDLAKSVMTLGGWSNFLCLGKEAQPSVDFALLFIGRELQSSDLSGRKHSDPALLDLLKASFTKSKKSLAFPYVSASEGNKAIENSLLSEFADSCGHDLGASDVAFTESCSMDGENFEKLEDTHSMHDYFVSKMEKRSKVKANLIVVCDAGSSSFKELEQSRQVFSEVLSSAEQSGAKYSVLYVSDPLRSIRYPSNHILQRFLAEGTTGNGSANSTTCDEVCQIKSSLLEGLFVAIVLLIILISGLCCMMGIDTPTRFEVPQDS